MRRRIGCVWRGGGWVFSNGGFIIFARLNSEKYLILEVGFKVRCLALMGESIFGGSVESVLGGSVDGIVKCVGMNVWIGDAMGM